ncbi:MAG: heme A synthase [Flavobacteriales bacterium]
MFTASSVRRLAWVSLVFVHLVIIAGSVVRMTGSGMGCPDWPKCFGYAIPPTSSEEVTWYPERTFKKGQMIVHEVYFAGVAQERLLVAQRDFTAGSEFDQHNWEVYTKHDYTVFNPVHTWIEFINRLIGALTGIPVLLLFVATLGYGFRERRWLPPLMGAAALFMLGFSAWLGKLVVDGNLIPGSITIHMFAAVALSAFLIVLVQTDKRFTPKPLGGSFALLFAALILALVQILLGTQVRESIDLIAREGSVPRAEWVTALGTNFEVHRSFSWMVMLLNLGWMWMARKKSIRIPEMPLALALLLIQLIGGIVLAYAEMPAGFQPLHLLGGILMFDVLWYATLRMGKSR